MLWSERNEPAVGGPEKILIFHIDEIFSIPNHLNVGLGDWRVHHATLDRHFVK